MTNSRRILQMSLVPALALLGFDGSWQPVALPEAESPAWRIAFADAAHGWVTAHFSGVFRTVDGGKTWQQRARLARGLQLEDVWFAPRGQGVVVGSQDQMAIVLRSADLGKTWQIADQSGSVSQGLTRLRFADGVTGWAVGIDGLLKSTDGGKTWAPRAMPRSAWLHGIAVIDPRTLWVTGGPGVLKYSRDAGDTWNDAALPREASSDFLWSIEFAADGRRGWVTGDGGVVLTTQDGGGAWRREVIANSGFLTDLAVTPDAVFVSSSERKLYSMTFR